MQMTNNMNIYHFFFIGSWRCFVSCALYLGLHQIQHALVTEGMLTRLQAFMFAGSLGAERQ